MATELSLNVKAGISWTFQDDRTFGPTVSSNSYNYLLNTTTGTGAGQCDLLVLAQGTIAASGNATFDLAGSLLDLFGNTITMLRAKVLYVEVTTDTGATSVSVGNGTNPFVNWVTPSTGAVVVRNGGSLQLVAPDATGYPVTAATGDILKLTNNDGVNAATYRIAVAGCSA